MSDSTGLDGDRILRLASERIGGDLQRTVARGLELRSADKTSDLDGLILVFLNGRLDGGIGWPIGSTDEELIVGLADLLQEHALHEEVWGGWPTCPLHGTHPLAAVLNDRMAVWSCPASNVVVARVGDLASG